MNGRSGLGNGWELVTDEPGRVRIEHTELGVVASFPLGGSEAGLLELKRFIDSIPIRVPGRPPGRRVTLPDVLRVIHDLHGTTGRAPKREEVLAALNIDGREVFADVESLSRALRPFSWRQLQHLAIGPDDEIVLGADPG